VEALAAGQAPFAEQMFVVNVWLVLFNLIPAFPMDGGRVLRAFLAMATDYARATQIAAAIGQGLALLFGLVGLFGSNPLLVFVALFVWMGAAGEASVAQMRAALAGIPVGRAMVREFVTVERTATLREVANKVLDGFQPDFPVVDGGKLVGVIHQSDLLRGLTASGPDATVEAYMQTQVPTADSGEMLDRAFARLHEGEAAVIPVVDDGNLVGLLTPENVSELLMIRKAIKARLPA
jgi:CBS domain-containing protein